MKNILMVAVLVLFDFLIKHAFSLVGLFLQLEGIKRILGI